MSYPFDFSLYLIADRSKLPVNSVENAVEQAIGGGVTLVQLRDKHSTSLEFYNLAGRVQKVTNRYHIPLIINDRLDIALAINADGVHLGQKDLPCREARQILGQWKTIGVSAATVAEAIKAEEDGADYIGTGAIFPTDTKKDTRSVSIKLLKEITNSVHIPVVAIGGIQGDNRRQLCGTGISGVAVVSAILGSGDIKKAAQDLKSIG